MSPTNLKKAKKNRKKPITWFNPPYSMNVATNVGREFLQLVDAHFPPGHPLHPVINRSTVKIGYRCAPNMGAQVAQHNSKIMRASSDAPRRPAPSCNCQKSKKNECPLPGACNQEGVIYQATIKNSKGDQETYVGLAEKFKQRHYKHRKSMEVKNPDNSTTLSTHYWTEFEAGRAPRVSWRILEKNIPPFNPVTGKCQLCIREKFYIIFKPNLATLNQRQEIFSNCRHKKSKLLVKAPD